MTSHINLCNEHLVDLGNQGKRYNFIDTIFQQLRTHIWLDKEKTQNDSNIQSEPRCNVR